MAMIKVNRLFIGRRSLHRYVALNIRITLGGVFQHGEVGEDQRVGTQLRRHIHGALPTGVTVRMRKSVNRDVKFAAMLMDKTHRFLQFFLGKVKAGEVTGIGIIF